MKSNLTLAALRFFPLFILAMLVTILAQAVHETGHLLFFQVTGREATWVFTKVAQLSEPPTNLAEWTEITSPDGSSSWTKVSSMPSGSGRAVMGAAGPLLGLFSAVLGLVMFRRSTRVTSKQLWLAFVLTISLVAVLYYLRAPMRTGGDEYDIAVNLGISKAPVEILFAFGYLACLVLGLRELPTWRVRFGWLGTILLGAILTGIPMTFIDPAIVAQVDTGNLWVRPVLGYSLPVFITIVLTFIGLWVWVRWQAGASK